MYKVRIHLFLNVGSWLHCETMQTTKTRHVLYEVYNTDAWEDDTHSVATWSHVGSDCVMLVMASDHVHNMLNYCYW